MSVTIKSPAILNAEAVLTIAKTTYGLTNEDLKRAVSTLTKLAIAAQECDPAAMEDDLTRAHEVVYSIWSVIPLDQDQP